MRHTRAGRRLERRDLDRIGAIEDPTTQISHAPERVVVKATRRPSGESCGWMSVFVDAMATAAGDEAAAPTPEVSMRQMFSSVKLRTYTSRAGLPDCERENAGIMPSSPTNGRRAGRPSPVAGSSPQTCAAASTARSKRGSLCHSGSHAALSGLKTRERHVPGLTSGGHVVSQGKHVELTGRPRRPPEERAAIGHPARQTGPYRQAPVACGVVNCLLSPVSSGITNNASGFPSPPVSVTISTCCRGTRPGRRD